MLHLLVAEEMPNHASHGSVSKFTLILNHCVAGCSGPKPLPSLKLKPCAAACCWRVDQSFKSNRNDFLLEDGVLQGKPFNSTVVWEMSCEYITIDGLLCYVYLAGSVNIL